MPDISSIRDLLNRSRGTLFAAAGAVPEACWRVSPRDGAWSAAEIFTHLCMVEGRILEGARGLLLSPPKQLPFWKRLHVPIRIVPFRWPRAKTPIPLDSRLTMPRDESIARHAALRDATLAFLEEQRGRDLCAFHMKHPFFGYLNFYAWFTLIGYHELRHTDQLQEIVRFFQKENSAPS